jgi:hypothetical protein
MKAARRNLGHDEAVQEVAFLQRRSNGRWGNGMANSPVDLNAVLRTLTQKRIPFVLTGAHGIAGWTGRPRNTLDVDILVKSGRNYARAVKALRELYPDLEVHNLAGVTGFFLPGTDQSVIDVTYPHRPDLAETLANPTWTDDKGLGLRYRVPALEAALANKYGAMLTPTRRLTKRAQDMVDFMSMVQHAMDQGRSTIDLEWLESLGEKVWPGGGGAEILRLVEEVKAGRAINLDALGTPL